MRDTCLCLHVQRGARLLARKFDDAFRSIGLTHGQFSLMMSLNRPQAARLAHVADFLGMDRTSLIAKLKPLERRGLVRSVSDARDRRNRLLVLTDAGRTLLAEAVPLWRATHADVDKVIAPQAQARLRADLNRLADKG